MHLVIYYLNILRMKKNNNMFKLIFVLVLLVYITAYYVSYSGYYEYKLQERTIITNEKIKEFESDIKNNFDMDLKDYLDNDDVDYENRATKLMYGFSNNGNKVARKIIKDFFRKLSHLLED